MPVSSPPDLFTMLDTVYNKRDPGEYPYHQVLNRFLASDRNCVQAALEISRSTWDDHMTWQFWRTALPVAPKAPYLNWPLAKKPPTADKLVQRLMEVHGVRRTVAEDMETLLRGARYRDVCRHYGIEAN